MARLRQDELQPSWLQQGCSAAQLGAGWDRACGSENVLRSGTVSVGAAEVE